MTSRQRQSAAAPVTTTPRSALPTPPKLPPYEPPLHALNPAARRALETLQRHHSTDKLATQLDDAAAKLTDTAGEINDALSRAQAGAAKRRARRARDDEDGEALDAAEEAKLRGMADEVAALTARLEAGVRKVIDGQAGLAHLDDALREVQRDAAAASTLSQTQTQTSTQAPTQTQHTAASSAALDATPAEASTAPPTPLVPALTAALARKTDAYTALAPRHRYASHNSYVGFKRVVHDAQHHGDTAPPLPPASTWFVAATGGPAPGVTGGADDEEDEDGDDIAIAAERTSTRCPLTLREFRDPVSSAKCPHSFERAAIEGLVRDAVAAAARGRGGRRGEVREGVVQCPVPGCVEMLRLEDLRTDAVLVRRIRRIQAAKEGEEEVMAAGTLSDGGEESGGEDVDMVGAGRVKVERASQRPRGEDEDEDMSQEEDEGEQV